MKNLEQKDEAEEEAKLQLRAQAKKELDDWYKQHAEQVIYHSNLHHMRKRIQQNSKYKSD